MYNSVEVWYDSRMTTTRADVQPCTDRYMEDCDEAMMVRLVGDDKVQRWVDVAVAIKAEHAANVERRVREGLKVSDNELEYVTRPITWGEVYLAYEQACERAVEARS